MLVSHLNHLKPVIFAIFGQKPMAIGPIQTHYQVFSPCFHKPNDIKA